MPIIATAVCSGGDLAVSAGGVLEGCGCTGTQGDFSVRRRDALVVSTGVAHVLTWVVAFWLVVGPVYEGVSKTVVTPGGVATSPQESPLRLSKSTASACFRC